MIRVDHGINPLVSPRCGRKVMKMNSLLGSLGVQP
jgi:hypothetical protein